MDIQSIRQQYPHYNDMTDDQLLSAMHKKYYSDIPYEKFSSKLNQPQKMVDEGPKNMFGIPVNTEDFSGKNIAQNFAGAALGMMPQVGLPARAAAALPAAGRFLANALTNIGAKSAAGYGIGAITPGMDPSETAKLMGKTEAAVSALPLPFKGIGAIAERIRPMEYANRMVDAIHRAYTNTMERASRYYRPVHEAYDQHMVTLDPERYLGYSQSQIDHFTPDIERAYNSFLTEPNFRNLHNLQSEMYRDMPDIREQSISQYQNIRDARRTAQNRLESFLSHDPEALENYQRGSSVIRNEAGPYRNNPDMQRIIYGETQHMPPERLQKALNNLIEQRGSVPAEHPIRGFHQDLTRRIESGQALGDIGTVLSGALLGNAVRPGAGGSAIGAYLAKTLSPTFVSLVQNPTARAAAQHAMVPVDVFKRAIQARNIPGKTKKEKE